jgi:regulator of RNase E activity RraA
MADGTAVVFIAAQDAEQVLAAAEVIVAREAAMATALERGLPETVRDVVGVRGPTQPDRAGPICVDIDEVVRHL